MVKRDNTRQTLTAGEYGAQYESPVKAIRQHCLDCSGGLAKEVRLCTCPTCNLYPFRMGKNPYLGKSMTPEQKAKAVERLRLAREKQQSTTPESAK